MPPRRSHRPKRSLRPTSSARRAVCFSTSRCLACRAPIFKQELIRRQQEIPIVFITANGDKTVRPRLLAQGAVECLFKPFSEAALLDALNAALRMR